MKFPRILGTPRFLIFFQTGDIIVILLDAVEYGIRKLLLNLCYNYVTHPIIKFYIVVLTPSWNSCVHYEHGYNHIVIFSFVLGYLVSIFITLVRIYYFDKERLHSFQIVIN